LLSPTNQEQPSVLPEGAPLPEDFSPPPKGCHLENTADGFVLSVSMHHRIVAAFFAAWSVFLTMAVIVFVWQERDQILAGDAHAIMKAVVAEALVCLVFVLPSLAVLRTKLVISSSGQTGQVFEGIMGLRWHYRFDWREVTSIDERFSYQIYRGWLSGDGVKIVINVGNRRIAFGSWLNTPSRRYIVALLRQVTAGEIRE
jgi:hypothetical protein